MENQKDNKKTILIIVIVLLLLIGIGVGAYFFLNRKTETPFISIVNGTSYPTFDENTSRYVVYTSESSLTFSCSGNKIVGCSEPIPVSTEKSNYSIIIDDKTYTFSITKVAPNSTTLKIKSVRGNPTVWTNNADLTVTVENSGEVKLLEYTFDGGETWGTSNIFHLNKNGKYKIQVRDYFGFLSDVETVDVTKVDTTPPTLEATREITGESEAILTAIAVDTLSGIDSYSWSTGATSPSITINAPGTYTVTVKDKAGNESRRSLIVSFRTEEEETSTLPETSSSDSGSGSSRQPTDNIQRGGDEDVTVIVRPTTPSNPPSTPTDPQPPVFTNRFVALFVGNGAEVGASSRACETTGSSCPIQTPTISRQGYEIIGWSSRPGSRTAEYSINQQITLSSNITLYAITKATFSATFLSQDPDHATVSSPTVSCEVFNEDTSCQIMTAALYMTEGYSGLGWNSTRASTTTGVPQNSTYNLSSNELFYSITKRDAALRALFIVLNPESATMSGGTTECTLFNGANECRLTAPTLTPAEDYTVLGWHDPEDANPVTFESGDRFDLSLEDDGKTFYAVVRSERLRLATFILQDPLAGTLSESSVSCLPETGSSSCSVNLPTFSANSGFEMLGWAETANATSATLSGNTILLETDKTFYSVTKKSSPLSVTFSLQDSRAATISGERNAFCELFNGATSCLVRTPSLVTNPGYDALGWNEERSATSGTYGDNVEIPLSESTTFYSITRESSPISAEFVLQAPSVSSLEGGTTSCRRYNGATTCEVIAPTLRGSNGHSALGWATSPDADSAEFASGAHISISGGETFYSITKKAITVTFHILSNTTTHECYLYQGSNSCTFTFPELENTSTHNFIGWNEDSTAREAQYLSGESLTVYDNADFYAISVTLVEVDFIIQDPLAATASAEHFTCNLFNGAASCEITTPNLSANSGYTAIGWNTNQGATTASVRSNSTLSVSEPATYYSITRKTAPVTATFENLASMHAIASGTSATCYLFNGAANCQITAPVLTSTDSSYIVRGWGTSADAEAATIVSGGTFTLGENRTFYSVVFSNHTISFSKNSSFTRDASETTGWRSWMNNNIAATSLSFGELSTETAGCASYNDDYCKLSDVPRIYSPGNNVIGWSPYPYGNDVYLPFLSRFIPTDLTLYARVWNWYSLDAFTLGTEYKILTDSTNTRAYYPVEFENVLTPTVVSSYSSYAETAFTKVPALKTLYGKMRVSSSDTYNGYSDDYSGSAGITYVSFGVFSPIDILSPYTNATDDYIKHAIIHELGHALDAAFFDHTGKYLHQYPEFITARDELLAARNAQSSSTPYNLRPLSAYAFSDERVDEDTGEVEGFEFIAEAFTAYYRDKFGGYADGSLGYTTDALNSAFSHYLCYARYNYNMETSLCE